MFNLTRKEAAAVARGVGRTLRFNTEWQEFQVYPVGTGMDHPSSYATNCLEDALRTALAMAENEEHGPGIGREFTTSEASDIECHPGYWLNEDTSAYHPIGDELAAIGDNLYRVYRADDEHRIQYFFDLGEALGVNLLEPELVK
jgi:hypothetical protein